MPPHGGATQTGVLVQGHQEVVVVLLLVYSVGPALLSVSAAADVHMCVCVRLLYMCV